MNKLQLLAIIIFGTVIFPLIFLTFASGSWYNPSDDPSDCRKCHAKICDEFQSNVGAHYNFTCGQCHLSSGLDYGLPASFNLTWLKLEADEPHVAISTRCVDCHSEPAQRLRNGSEAHCRFYSESLNLSVTSSSTCIACHNHVSTSIMWTRNEYVSYDVSSDYNGYIVTWNESDNLGSNVSWVNSTS